MPNLRVGVLWNWKRLRFLHDLLSTNSGLFARQGTAVGRIVSFSSGRLGQGRLVPYLVGRYYIVLGSILT